MQPTQCTIADAECKSPGVSANEGAVMVIDERLSLLNKAVEILNEAHIKAVGAATYMHWPLLFAGDAETTAIECFLTNQTPTTNLLGVINGFLAYEDSFGFRHRITFSVEESRYSISTVQTSG